MKTMKNRGMLAFISSGIDDWKLPKRFSAVHVLPFVQGTFPHATTTAVGAVLRHNPSFAKKIGRALYSKPTATAAAEMVADDAIIDEALNALAKVEAALRQQKAIRAKMAEMRRMLNGD